MTDFLDSPFEAHLHTNFVPSDAQCAQIRADLAPHLVQLALVNERIRELSAERDKLQAYVDSHTALISYPRRVPVDVVREIFVACLPTDRNPVMSAQEAPLLLSRICSSWRGVALTTPSLWGSLHIPVDFIVGDPVERSLALKDWLQLSGALPISLSLDAPSGNHAFPPELVDALVESAGRWRRVEFRDLTLQVLSALDNIHTPILESVKAAGWVPNLRQFPLFSVPSLRTVHLHSQGSENLDNWFLDLPFRWNTLAHLTLHSTFDGLSPGNVLKLLRQCHRLVSFAFPANGKDWDHTSVSQLISLPFLKSFIILEPRLDLQTVGHLLQNLVTPELRQLHIPTEVPSSLENHHPFISALKNLPLLESLLIHHSSFTEPVILETLRSLPNLTKLTVANSGGRYRGQPADNEESYGLCRLLGLLTPGESQATVCPRLQELEIRDCDSVLPRVALESFVRKRMQLHSGFRRLEIIWRTFQKEELFSAAEIQEFRSQGVRVALMFPRRVRIAERPRLGLPVPKLQTPSLWGSWD
ncbi:hypothetical protein FB45DRAFT_890785 [Roridomyces roridus]|uniref:F-box domain-containing protein n=1 Tax=Roridomyces roridus TaxID=1738132 RepID=A0AAD7FZE5_9AGAR|nr:hypothetical protein FB45DRAFT_890785 [Roridomyces roridus]